MENANGRMLITEAQLREAGRDSDMRDVLLKSINAEADRLQAETAKANAEVAKLNATPEARASAEAAARHVRRQSTLQHYAKPLGWALVLAIVGAVAVVIVNSVGYWMLQLS